LGERDTDEGAGESVRRVAEPAGPLRERVLAAEIKRRDAVFAALLSIYSYMQPPQLLGDICRHTLDEILSLFDAERGFIARYGDTDMRIVVERGYGPTHEGEAGRIFAKLLAGEGADGLSARLVCEERSGGFIHIERETEFSPLDGEFLRILASQLSLGFDRIFLREKIHQQNFELRRMSALKNNFIGHLSADLQQPMERIIRLLEEESAESKREALGFASRLKKGIDKIISIFSLQQEVDEMYSHGVQIDAMIHKVVAAFQDELAKRGVTIEYDFSEGLVPFSGNYDTIYTIVDEIICNAIVYNKKGGRVRIGVEQKDHVCRVRVRDTGVGISEDRVPRVFERFYRAPSSGELHNRGAGLGLYIVREFIEAYGGAIGLTSEEGEGTEVVLTFPMWRAHKAFSSNTIP